MSVQTHTLTPSLFLGLISSKGGELFYEKFGFERRPCDWDGGGMFKMIRK